MIKGEDKHFDKCYTECVEVLSTSQLFLSLQFGGIRKISILRRCKQL